MKRSVYSAVLIICLFSASTVIPAGTKGTKSKSATASNGTSAKLNQNNISTWIYNDGATDVTPQNKPGFVYPNGRHVTAVFESGLIWGAKLNGTVQVGGSTYNHGLQPGKIISPGVAEDTTLEKNRVYRVMPDYKNADFSLEASETGKTQKEIFQQYEKDWNEWPAQEGAPYTDVNGNGKYDPDTDIPGVKDALQTIWFVSNDLNAGRTTGLYGSQPMGIEMQATFWTYNRDFYLNNTYFRKYKIINKSNTAFNDMYLGMWADPDVGDSGDDYVGCDTTLNLAFAYNATDIDALYGGMGIQATPAVGFDLLQGPRANGSFLPMTSFCYFAQNEIPATDPTLGSYEGTIQMYNFLQGKVGKTGLDFKDPQGKTTKYFFSGDPYTGSGWIDGQYNIQAFDRRMCMSSGPFSMVPGDTQEVAFSETAVIGKDHLHSVWLLKQYDKKIQQYYSESFNFNNNISAPEAPAVSAHYTKEGIYLEWAADSLIEKYSKDGFKFEGFNVYQLPNANSDRNSALRLATYDLVNGVNYIYGEVVDSVNLVSEMVQQQYGSDSGIRRSFLAQRDSLGRSELLTGKRYIFGVSAYTYQQDPNGEVTNSESPMRIVSVVYQDTLKGYKYLDTLKVTRISGSSDNMIKAVVIDPAKLTGHEYEVGVENNNNNRTVYLKDNTTGKILSQDVGFYQPDNPYAVYPVIDGIRIVAQDVLPGMKDYSIVSGERKWTWVNADGLNLEGFNGAIGNAYTGWFSNTTVHPQDIPNVLIKFATTDGNGNIIDPNDANASFAYRYLRKANSAPAKPEFQQYIKNASPGYAYQDFTKSMPFAAFNAETGQRLAVGFLEHNSIYGRLDGKYWPPSSEEGIENSSTNSPREWFFIFNVPYSEVSDPQLQKDILSETVPMSWFGMPTRRGASTVAFSGNDQFLILKRNMFTTADKFTFKSDNLSSVKPEGQQFKYELSQNYPNPFNPKTQIRFSLAERGFVTLRVYNILGQMVKELANGDMNPGSYKMEFDGSRLASGIYLYRLDVKDRYSDVKKMSLIK